MSQIGNSLHNSLGNRRYKRKEIKLNILLIGENGVGKKTFINTVCNQSVFEDDGILEKEEQSNEFSIESKILTLMEDDYPIRLKISYTRNFGLQLDNSGNSEKVKAYIEQEYKKVLEEEMRINRNINDKDDRIHVALYFLRPTCRKLSDFDIGVLKTIGDLVNVIPIISKSDTLTLEELDLNKKLINASIRENEISIFKFEDELDISIREKIPFGVISSNLKDNSGKHYRNFPWGNLVIEDTDCDFLLLRSVLLNTHFDELKDITVNHKFEKYRSEQLTQNQNLESSV